MQKFKATLMDEAAVIRALKRISHEILERNRGCSNVCIVGIKRKGIELARILADNIYAIEGKSIPVGELDITLYRDDFTAIATDPVIHPTDIPFNIKGMDVILVDDVIFTGRTVRAALDALMDFGRPSTVQLAVLIDRGHRDLPIKGDYVGKNVPTSKSEEVVVKIPPFNDTTCVELYDKE